MTVDRFYETALPVLKGMNIEYEMIFVNDGSKDSTLDRLTALAKKDKNVKVIAFSRNFGQQAAIICGFRHSTGDCVAELDCDLQDPVELLPTMYEKFLQGFEVVHGRRVKRKGDSVFKRATAWLYYKFLAKISSVHIPRDTGDFKLMSRRVIQVICDLPEHEKYLRGLESWVGFSQTFVDFERRERVAGKTHYSFKKMASLARAGIIANSNRPLLLSLKVGVALGVLSVLGLVALIIVAACGVSFDACFYLLPVMCALSAAGYTFNGISNLYLANVYNEVKNRPEYVIDRKINLDE